MKTIYLVCCFAMISACAPAAGDSRSGGGDTDAGAAAPECTRTRDCADNERCVDQACVEVEAGCTADNDCPAGQRCDDVGQCVEPAGCTENSDCLVEGQVCENSVCKSSAYGQCASNDDCAEGTQCLLEDQQGQKYCGTLCTEHPACAGHEQCMQSTVCAPNVCEGAGLACDAHATADGLCLAVNPQANFCIAGVANGAGCEPFAQASTCADSESCQPVSAALPNTYCGAAGSLAVGAPCESGLLAGGGFGADECVQGAFCLATGQGTVCLGYCRLGQNDDCPEMDGAATVCQPMSALHASLADSPWGVCAPPQ